MNSRCRNDVRLHIQNVTESLILEIPTPCGYVVYTAQWFKSTQGLWILRRSPLSSFRLYFSTIIACAITSSRAKNVVCLKTPLPCRTHPMQNAMCGLIRAFQIKHLPKTGFVPLVPLVAPSCPWSISPSISDSPCFTINSYQQYIHCHKSIIIALCTLRTM